MVPFTRTIIGKVEKVDANVLSQILHDRDREIVKQEGHK
jgi:hypothetical protein